MRRRPDRALGGASRARSHTRSVAPSPDPSLAPVREGCAARLRIGSVWSACSAHAAPAVASTHPGVYEPLRESRGALGGHASNFRAGALGWPRRDTRLGPSTATILADHRVAHD